MRLADFVARTPTARLATPEDNPRILAFFDRAPMGASAFAVQYQRAPDFFHLLRWQSDRSHVFITVDERGAVRSMATVSLRPGWVDDRPTTVGYLGDLRVAFDRASIRRWRRFYGELLACAPEIEELADCTHWYTAVIDDNRLARLAIGHERAGAPVHVPLAAFTMRNLVARLPGFRPRLPRGWRVRSAAAGDAARIDDFFERENRALPLGFRAELGRRLARWDGLSLGDFLVVEDGDELLACAAPWSPAAAKRTVVSRVPVPLALAGRAARIWPGRAPLRVPVAGEPLRMLYLTNLVFARRPQRRGAAPRCARSGGSRLRPVGRFTDRTVSRCVISRAGSSDLRCAAMSSRPYRSRCIRLRRRDGHLRSTTGCAASAFLASRWRWCDRASRLRAPRRQSGGRARR